MNVWLKRVLFGLVVALLVAVVGLAIFLLTFNPNAYKSRLETLVFDRYARTLTIGGDIGLSLFPRIGLSVSDVSLSNRDTDDTFVSVDSARFAVAIWPLLSNQLVVDHVAISGLKAWVVRDADGRFNFSDLLGSGQPAPAPQPGAAPVAAAVAAVTPGTGGHSDFNIDIAGLELKGGQIHYIDQRDGLSTTLSGIEANTGRVTYDQPFDVSLKATLAGADPVQNARLEAQALLRLDPAVRGYSAQKINVQVTGRMGNLDKANVALKGRLSYNGTDRYFSAGNLELALSGDIVGAHPVQGLKASLAAEQLRLDQRNTALNIAKLSLRATGQDQGRAVEIALDAPALSISPDSAQADPVTGTLKWTGDDTLAVSLGLEGLTGNASEWQFRTVSLDGALTQGQRLLRLKLTSPLTWDTSLRKGALSAIKGDMGVRDQALPDGAYEFPMIGSVHLDLVQGLLNADLNAVIEGGQAAFKSQTTRLTDPQTRFSLKAEKINLNRWLPTRQATPEKPAAGDTPEKTPDAAGAPVVPAPPHRIDLSFLKGLDIQGGIQIDNLIARDIQLTNVEARLNILNDALAVSKLSADLYEGALGGQFSATADHIFKLKLNLDKVAVAPLLQAAAGQNLVSGQGSAQIDLHATGATLDALQRAVSGRVAWQVRDGAVHGVDASRTLSDAATALGNVVKGRLDAMPSPFDKQRSTPFTSLDGRLDLKDGQGTVSKLSLVSSLVRISEGKPATIDIPGQRLDLTLLVRVAARAPKASAISLGALAGATIPVRITGAWAAPDYAVQWSDVRDQTIQRALKSGLLDLLKGRDSIDQALPVPEAGETPKSGAAPANDDTVERIGKALKGLLGQ